MDEQDSQRHPGEEPYYGGYRGTERKIATPSSRKPLLIVSVALTVVAIIAAGLLQEYLLMIVSNNYTQKHLFTFLRDPKLDQPKQNYGLRCEMHFNKRFRTKERTSLIQCRCKKLPTLGYNNAQSHTSSSTSYESEVCKEYASSRDYDRLGCRI
jgi:hypothetical protein